MANGRPWWKDDPDIAAATQRALDELASGPERPAADEPDPVLAEFYSGAISRELAAIRDQLAELRVRRDTAVRAARDAGLTWAEIGKLLHVSRQQVHRQFGRKL